jgi:hypothetical protein
MLYQYISRIVDSMFIIDLIMNFRTTIINEMTTEEILDEKQIAMSYIKGRFFLDLLSTIPLDYIIQGNDQISGAHLKLV